MLRNPTSPSFRPKRASLFAAIVFVLGVATIWAQGAVEYFVSQSTLSVGLREKATLTVIDARGQQLIRLQGHRGWQQVPLRGVDYGFLILTVQEGGHKRTYRFLHDGR